MKIKVLDQPEREIDPIKMLCCSYSLFSWGTSGLMPEPKKVRARLAKVAKAKSRDRRFASAKVAKRKMAVA